MLTAQLIEINTAFGLWFLSAVVYIQYQLLPIAALGILFSGMCILDVFTYNDRGVAYRVNSLLGREPPFTLGDVDRDTLAREREVIINE
jgi:hypothetical protein